MAQIKIEVLFDPAKENLRDVLKPLVDDQMPAKYEQMVIPEFTATKEITESDVKAAANVDKAVKAAEAEAKAATTPVEEPAEAPEELSDEEKLKALKRDIRALALALSKSNKAKLGEVLAGFGATRLADVDPADYQTLHEKLVSARG